MNNYTISDLRDGPLRNTLISAARGKRIVPVIGAGFSCGLPARNGCVPDGTSLARELVSIMGECGFIDGEEACELQGEGFSEVVLSFFDVAYPEVKEEWRTDSAVKARELFRHYVEGCFTYVSGLSSSQREFLQCGWPYLYTLNLDDAIESALDVEYKTVVPYSDVDRSWYERGHKCLIKLHGDAREMLRSHSGTTRIVLDSWQYLNSLTDDRNATLLQWLVDDCTSKDLLFVGCSLEGEQDLLFAQHAGISSLSDVSSQNSLYVYYDQKGSGSLPNAVARKLKRYRINNVLVLAPDEFEEFYHIVATICTEQMQRVVEDELDRYSGFSFRHLATRDTSIDHILCDPDLVSYAEGSSSTVTLPSFYVQRSVVKKVVDSLDGDGLVCTVLGRRYSGKTYALLGIVELLQRRGKVVYFFTRMRLADQAIGGILKKRDCVVVFDTDTIEARQVTELTKLGVDELKARGLKYVFAVNQSDKYFIENAMQASLPSEYACRFELENTFVGKELGEFNKRMGELLLVERLPKQTFLDYALQVGESVLKMKANVLPDSEFLATAESDMLVAVIALAIQPSMYVNTANRLGITDELSTLCKSRGRAVQKDYLDLLEVGASGHSGTKYVSNSVYWLTKCLRNYAKVPGRHKNIASAFGTIIVRQRKGIRPSFGSQYAEFYRSMKPYMYFDTLGDLFGESKSWEETLDLFHQVYGELSGQLSDSYQFLHQYAKCEHRRAQFKSNPDEVLACLTSANTMLDRAFQIASRSNGPHAQDSLTHIQISKALTLTTYLRSFDPPVDDFASQLAKAIDSYYYAFVSHPQQVAEGFASEAGASFRWFVDGFLNSDGCLRGYVIDSAYRVKVEEVLSSQPLRTRWPRRNLRICWDAD